MATPAKRSGTDRLRRGVRWLVINRRTGGVTVAQWPNFALWVFLAASVAQRFDHAMGSLDTALRILGTVALIAWASDEIVRGVNPFRRMLGFVVLAVTIAGLVG